MDDEQHLDLRNTIAAAAMLARDMERYLNEAEHAPTDPEAQAEARRAARVAEELRRYLERRRHATGCSLHLHRPPHPAPPGARSGLWRGLSGRGELQVHHRHSRRSTTRDTTA
jgi:hypothetical protein